MTKKEPTPPLSPATLDSYDRLIATIPELKRKGENNPYTSLNGHMFSFLGEDGLVAIRLPQGAREAFLEKYHSQLCIAHGTVMKEYISVPADLLAHTEELKPIFETSFAYVKSLKPKPTKKAGG